jgi:hypothetical protein
MINVKIEDLKGLSLDYAIAYALNYIPILGVKHFYKVENSFRLGVFADGQLFKSDSDDFVYNTVLPIIEKLYSEYSFVKTENKKWNATACVTSTIKFSVEAESLKEAILKLYLKIAGFEYFSMDDWVFKLCNTSDIYLPQI